MVPRALCLRQDDWGLLVSLSVFPPQLLQLKEEGLGGPGLGCPARWLAADTLLATPPRLGVVQQKHATLQSRAKPAAQGLEAVFGYIRFRWQSQQHHHRLLSSAGTVHSDAAALKKPLSVVVLTRRADADVTDT